MQRFINKNIQAILATLYYFLAFSLILLASLIYKLFPFILAFLIIILFIFSASYFSLFLLKLFFKAKLYKGKYSDLISKFIKSNSIKIENIYERPAKMSSADACGFGKNKAIIFCSPLLEKHPINEIEAVTAHELGHLIHKDPLLLVSIIAFFVSLFGLLNSNIHYANVGIFFIFVIMESFVSYLLYLMFARSRETLADQYAYAHLKDRKSFASFFRKYIDSAKKSGIEIRENPNYLSKIFATHPPMYERIRYFEN